MKLFTVAIFDWNISVNLDTVLLCNWVSKRIGSNGVMKNVLGKMTTDTGCQMIVMRSIAAHLVKDEIVTKKNFRQNHP
ncbi:hypothetical protein T12_617 [Trichinella patagoniensis]|uniref:Uncharacterized protein n=1 Tax=Trichinella patagoniensis TaxID=990121 RepID=A0A0V1A0F5_9BILA|nr:hypothetical protein T12_617 [Trichinella patagoniensis]